MSSVPRNNSAKNDLNGRHIFWGLNLVECIEECNMSQLRNLLEDERVDPNVLLPDVLYTPMHMIAAAEDEDFAVEAAKEMLRHNGDPNVRADEGLTPVHVAANNGKDRILQTLLDAGGSCWLEDETGRTAFDYAKECNNPEVNRVLSQFSGLTGQRSVALLSRVRSFRSNKGKPRTRRSFGRKDVNKITPSICNLSTHIEENEKSSENDFIHLTYSDSEISEIAIKIEDDSEPNESELVEVTHLNSDISSVPQFSSTWSDIVCMRNADDCSNLQSQISGSGNFLKIPGTSGQTDLTSSDLFTSSCHTISVTSDSKSSHSADNRLTPILSGSDLENITRVNVSQRQGAIFNKSRALHYPRLTLMPPEISKSISESVSDLKVKKKSRMSLARASLMEPNTIPEEASFSGGDCSNESDLSVTDKLNMAAIESGLSHSESDSSRSCDTEAEYYKYTDEEEGIILLEERWLVNPVPLSDVAQTDQSSSSSRILTTGPETCDTDSLREELKAHGIYYGPVTTTTKRTYQRQLQKKKKFNLTICNSKSKYSNELEKTFRPKNSMYFLARGAVLNQMVAEQFSSTSQRTRWREGNLKTSFTYLLLDPRITQNLPCRSSGMPAKKVWSIFLQSIFYVGKGKRSRPYYHLYEAVQKWRSHEIRYSSSKVKHIREIWLEGLGVICLHVFQNIIPVEAYTREAAMIDALGVQNLCNLKRSDYYGCASKWHTQEQRIFGVYMLYKALQIFLAEGERHLSPWDIM